jgi:hypothetical protein
MSQTKLSKKAITDQVVEELRDFIKEVKEKYPFVDGISWYQYSSLTIFCDGQDVPFSMSEIEILVRYDNLIDSSLYKEDIDEVEIGGERFAKFNYDLLAKSVDSEEKICIVNHPDAEKYKNRKWHPEGHYFESLTSDIYQMLSNYFGDEKEFFLLCLGDPVIVHLTEKGIHLEEYEQ